MTLVINDIDFYRAEEAKIRDAMKDFETGLLSLADQAVKDAGFQVENFPKEGYYYETPELQAYFDRIRTLQSKHSKTITPAITELHEIYTNPVFGIKQARPTAINPDDFYHSDDNATMSTSAIISPMMDPISIASDKVGPDWTIDKIMGAVDRHRLGTCLVGLGIIVDENEKEKSGKYNPLATCMACETTVLSRAVITKLGLPNIEWRVSPNVKRYGKKVIDAYNSLFEKYSKVPLKLSYVSGYDVESFEIHSYLLSDMLRCVHLNTDFQTGRFDSFYHWAIEYGNPQARAPTSAYKVVDFFDDRIITTQEWQKKKDVRV